jgi:hypothetical protein
MSLPGPEQRFELMIEQALSGEALWSLESHGRLIRYRLQDGALALPLWPSQEAAALESPGPEEQPCAITLETLIQSLLPQAAREKALVAAFPLQGSAYVCEASLLLERLINDWDETD